MGVSQATILGASLAVLREPAAIRVASPFTVNVDRLASGGVSANMLVAAAATANALKMYVRMFIVT
jgi:hypothetical protein